MISIVGAGSGAADLITVRGARLLGQADVIVYAGSLVNPQLLSYAKEGCEIHNSAKMTLEEVVDVMAKAHFLGKNMVRLHTGDPSIYGAIREQMDALRQKNIPFEVVPGVSSFCGAAAALQAEYTLPGAGKGEHPLSGRSPGHHGHFSVGRAAGAVGRGPGGRRISAGDPGGHCLQGHLAR